MRSPLLSRLGSLTVLVLLLAIVPACASSLPEPPNAKKSRSAKAPKAPKVPAMVVLDASGSMKVADAPGPRFAAAQQAIHTLVDSLGDGHPIGLVTYGTGTGNSEAEKAKGCQDITTAVPFGKLDKAKYNAAADALKPSGYTPIGTAITKASAELPKKGKRAVGPSPTALTPAPRPTRARWSGSCISNSPT